MVHELVNRSHFGTGILWLGPLVGAVSAVRKKVDLRVFFSTFWGQKKKSKFAKKYFSVRIEKYIN
jgi:hypothetical protein